MGWVVNATPRPLYPRQRDPGSFSTSEENLPPAEFDPRTVQPVRGELKYRLSYPGTHKSLEPLEVRPTTRLCRWLQETLRS